MASRKRTAGSSKKARTDSENPVSMTTELQKYFSSEDQCKEFRKSFYNREIQKPRILDATFFKNQNFEFLDWLEHAGLVQFLSSSDDVYPELIKMFYCNLRFSEGILTSEVCHKPIALDCSLFGFICGLPVNGALILDDAPAAPLADEYNRIEAIKSMLWDVNDVSAVHITAGLLNVENRLLHYVVARLLFPRRSNFAQLLRFDVPVMWVLKNQKNVNWAALVMQHMYDQRTPGSLPYAHLVTRILTHFGIPFQGEIVFRHDHFFAWFNEHSLNKIGLENNGSQWWPKHRGAHPAPPPPANVPPSFSTGASSSQAVPPPVSDLGMSEITALLQQILLEQKNTTESVNALHLKVDGLEATLRDKQIFIDSPIHQTHRTSSAASSASDDDDEVDLDESDEDS